MTVGSLFSGVGGFDMGLEAAGMRVLWQVEADRQCRSVLRRHWPDAALHDDVRDVGRRNLEPVDIVCGGSPCQAFSVAGLRDSLDDDRGNLVFEFVRVCDELDPGWIVWENVPGVLSTRDNAFGCFLAGLVGADAPFEPPGRWKWTGAGVAAGPRRAAAWRILDSQHFGVPQRRRRVFVIASRGDSGVRCAAALLPLTESVPGDPAAGGEAGQIAPTLATSGAGTARPGGQRSEAEFYVTARQTGRGYWNDDGLAGLRAHPGGIAENIVAGQCQGSNVGKMGTLRRGNGNVTGGVPFIADTLVAGGRELPPHDKSHPNGGGQVAVARANGPAVPRRLTPTECERLQAWADGHTRYGTTVPPLRWTATRPLPRRAMHGLWTCRCCGHYERERHGYIDHKDCPVCVRNRTNWKPVELADSPRYRMAGNGVTASVVEWIGRRIMTTGATS